MIEERGLLKDSRDKYQIVASTNMISNPMHLLHLSQFKDSLVPFPFASLTIGSFHPHGIGLWKSDSETLIFAVNHGIASEGESVVIFKYENSTLYSNKNLPKILTF